MGLRKARRWIDTVGRDILARAPQFMAPRRKSDAAPTSLAVAAIFKNEAPYILEWVAWHRCLGANAFFIADNESTDGTTEILAALAKAGIVEHVLFPGTPGQPPQLPAYRMLMDRFRSRAQWISLIDADEFLLPATGTDGLPLPLVPWLQSLPDKVGAVLVNWAIYGSSGEKTFRPGLVTERFSMRAQKEHGANQHVKSIVRTADYRSARYNPHIFVIDPWRMLVSSDGKQTASSTTREGVIGSAVWGHVRLNHYVIKSAEEFWARKVARGRPDTYEAQHQRNQSFFDDHDANDVSDPPPAAFLAQVRAEMARLAALIGPEAPEPT